MTRAEFNEKYNDSFLFFGGKKDKLYIQNIEIAIDTLKDAGINLGRFFALALEEGREEELENVTYVTRGMELIGCIANNLREAKDDLLEIETYEELERIKANKQE